MKSDTYHILGVDPGLTTGWVLVQVLPDSPAVVLFSDEVKAGPIATAQVIADRTIGYVPNLTVVYEKFITLSHDHFVDANPPIQLIGIIEWLCFLSNVPVHSYVPKFRTQIPEPSLKMSGYWLKGGEGHKRQALRHVLAHLVRQGHTPTIEKIFPRD